MTFTMFRMLLQQLLIRILDLSFAHTVYWMMKTKPVIFGEDVELFCNYNKTSNHSCDECTKRWHLYLASDFKLLSFNGFPSEISKYNTTDSPDGFGLVIKNFSEQDLTGSYRCSYGFENDRKTLDIGNDYECYPMNSTLDSRYSFNDHTILTMGVDFKEVHPYPNCTTSFNSKDITSKVITKSELIQLFYKVTFTLTLNIKDYGFCKGVLHMTCLIGSKQLDPIKTTFDECFDNKNQWVIIASLIACVSIIAIMCIVICRNKRCRNKLKDALPCTKSTRETDSNEMTDFVDEKNKSGEKSYMRIQTKRTTEAMIVTDIQDCDLLACQDFSEMT
ncbi:uncharacterized protein LOC127702610 isoform X1 [Mytilus californianus]|uniref:uncharacterized protein LOC127702610 isoform X1 n=1 Tax=Mytilus californianus TaxID=6549 RepID=UPI002246090C|nr:uncharacterized protein LOC127702610 isoform X1 [Mytilus californianus]XP_052062847.1 uncharacterized protein LOC127702610 isoform X1 [Mytilus californianus]XP_052062848.1 uncharacterized protein LOC127702610 isoform X1 [Mytilus californianus]XP_052062849.1 uncharacterized protein LOC127702610 isoform X1 [Mytilus californianus]